VPAAGGGQKPLGVYAGSPLLTPEPAPWMPDEIGFRLSPGIFDGGVKRLPTLTFAGDG